MGDADPGTRGQFLRMSIEVDLGVEPVRGRIGPAGAERDFVGWTELAAAIEECARHRDRGQAAGGDAMGSPTRPA